MWIIEYFEKANGRKPAKEFIDDLSAEEQVRIMRDFGKLSKLGTDAERPLRGYLRDHINEIRTTLPNRKSRIFFFFFNERNKIILTHGIIKKSGKVPDSEIEKAIRYRKEYFKRKGKYLP